MYKPETFEITHAQLKDDLYYSTYNILYGIKTLYTHKCKYWYIKFINCAFICNKAYAITHDTFWHINLPVYDFSRLLA